MGFSMPFLAICLAIRLTNRTSGAQGSNYCAVGVDHQCDGDDNPAIRRWLDCLSVWKEPEPGTRHVHAIHQLVVQDIDKNTKWR